MTIEGHQVICTNCGHWHPTEPCSWLSHGITCNCMEWKPMLSAFAPTHFKGHHKHEAKGWKHWALVALAFTLLSLMFLWAVSGHALSWKSQLIEASRQAEREEAKAMAVQWGQPKREPMPLAYKRLSPTSIAITCVNMGDPTGHMVEGVLIISCGTKH